MAVLKVVGRGEGCEGAVVHGRKGVGAWCFRGVSIEMVRERVTDMQLGQKRCSFVLTLTLHGFCSGEILVV